MPLMLLAWQPVLGRGTSKSQRQPASVQHDAMKLNFVGAPDACSPNPVQAADAGHVFGTVVAT